MNKSRCLHYQLGVLQRKTAFVAGNSGGINLAIAQGVAEARAQIAIISRKIDSEKRESADLAVWVCSESALSREAAMDVAVPSM